MLENRFLDLADELEVNTDALRFYYTEEKGTEENNSYEVVFAKELESLMGVIIDQSKQIKNLRKDIESKQAVIQDGSRNNNVLRKENDRLRTELDVLKKIIDSLKLKPEKKNKK